MNREWFSGCNTIEEVRKRYRDLAKQYHPDLGGDNETMVNINRAYTRACDYYTRHKNPERPESFYKEQEQVNMHLQVVIVACILIPGIRVEICGAWVWVSGNTKPWIETFKKLGMQWAPKKKMWYYAGVPASGRHAPLPIEAIRALYGSYVVKDDQEVEK